jgi:hypothetical protein
MLAVAQDIATVALETLGQPPLTTTLYDLIAVSMRVLSRA